jgi:retinol dehydrogenase 12
LVCLLLLPNLAKAARLHASASRVVIVGSGVHFWTKLEDDAIYSEQGLLAAMSDKNYPSPALMTKYFQSKRTSHSLFVSAQSELIIASILVVLNVLFTRAFAHHLSDPNAVIPTVVDPGLCGTDLGRNYSLTHRLYGRLMRMFLGWTSEEGSRQLVYAALGPDGHDGPHVRKHMSGAYVSLQQVAEPSNFVISKKGWEVQEQLWVGFEIR